MMLSRFNLSTKILITLLPLFLLTVGISVYLTHHYQEKQALEQMQNAAYAQAAIIKESLVEMMLSVQRVNESYLQRISQTRDVENISVWFFTDSLHLESDLVSPPRLQRLRERELKPVPELAPIAQKVFSSAEPQWLVQCEIGKHTEGLVHVFATGRPLLLRSCERLKVILPFTADRRCLECHRVNEGTVLGAAYMEMSLEKTVRALSLNTERTLWIFGIFTLAALAIGTVSFRAFVSQPIKRLVNATHIIGGGNLDHSIAAEFAADELGELAHSFDLMQRKLKESQEQLLHKERLSAIGKMASTIVHDLRSPLSAVLLALDRVKKNCSSAEQHILDIVRASILRINRMAQELLDFSRGDLRIERREVNIPKFIHSLSNELAPTFQQNQIRFSTRVSFEGAIVVDRDRLHRSLQNIIANAVDVLPHGGEIELRVLRDKEDVVFIIRDTGPGIPKEIQPKVFDPFVTAGKAKGTGLGLSITKEIVELHGGSISFESSPSNGTTFFVRIPLEDKSASLRNPSTSQEFSHQHTSERQP